MKNVKKQEINRYYNNSIAGEIVYTLTQRAGKAIGHYKEKQKRECYIQNKKNIFQFSIEIAAAGHYALSFSLYNSLRI